MKGTIVLIDDNRLDIMVATSVLEKFGYACYGFDDYTVAVAWLEQNNPQMIFLDLVMPEIAGYAVLEILRKKSELSQVPIIIMSGKNQTEDVKKAIQLGANDYIVKPMDPLVIQEKVRKVNSQNEGEFSAVDWQSNLPGDAYFGEPFKIVSISEFGIKVLASHPIKSGKTIEMVALSKELFGTEKLMARCLSSEKAVDKDAFYILFTFVGMQEAQRQIIRKLCRRMWIQSKAESA